MRPTSAKAAASRKRSAVATRWTNTTRGEPNSDGDESMDGDHESGLASAGFGMDEDYLPGGCDDLGGDW